MVMALRLSQRWMVTTEPFVVGSSCSMEAHIALIHKIESEEVYAPSQT
jgi:hypothetical protein